MITFFSKTIVITYHSLAKGLTENCFLNKTDRLCAITSVWTELHSVMSCHYLFKNVKFHYQNADSRVTTILFFIVSGKFHADYEKSFVMRAVYKNKGKLKCSKLLIV